MSFYPHNVDYEPPVAFSGGGGKVTGAKVADLLKYEVAPLNTGTVNLHAAVTLDAAITKTAGTSVVLETAVATDVLLTVTVGTELAIGDILKDDAKAEKCLVTAIADAPIYTVQRAYSGTALATHAAGATWKTVGKRVAITLLATELAACPQVVQVKGVKAGGALTGDVKVYGTNIKRAAINDTIALNDDAAVPGVKAFKTVTAMDLPLRTTAADTVSLGTVKTIGLPWYVVNTAHMLLGQLDGSADTGTITYDDNELEKCVYAPSGTPNGTKKLVLYIIH
jgi:hypothetical protein